MDPFREPDEPIPTEEHIIEPYYDPPHYYKTFPTRPTLAEADSTALEEMKSKYEAMNEVHIGPLGAPDAPSVSEPSAPVVSGGRVLGGNQDAVVGEQPQPVANVAAAVAQNQAVGGAGNGPRVLGHALPNDVGNLAERRRPSMSFSDWTDEEYEDYTQEEDEDEEEEEEEEEEDA
ncbi:unnamed protein product [Caenorhabditis brenneri]